MLHSKDIKNLSELTTAFCDRHQKAEFFREYIKVLKLGKFQATFRGVKQKGISALFLIEILICSAFTGQRNVHRFVQSFWGALAGYGKDAYYRIKANGRINWRNFLLGVARQAVDRTAGTDPDRSGPAAFIFDDTTLEKTGLGIEGVSRVRNHVVNRAVLGYQLLVMGHYNGSVLMPIGFSLHREKGKNKKMPFGLKPKHYRQQYRKKRCAETPGHRRKKELDESKVATAGAMIKRAVAKGFAARYVLTDSWYTCWQMVSTALGAGLPYIGMFSKARTLFLYRGEELNYRSIRERNRKNIKRNRRFKLYYIRAVVEWNGAPVVLYFTRKGKRGKWRTLLSTDTSSGFRSTVEVYQIRWGIEVFFREARQLLGLGQEQSTDLDAQIAHTTLILVQHIFLSLKNQVEQYESMGRLFENTRAETLGFRLHERFIALLIALLEVIDELLEGADAQKILRKAIQSPEAFEKLKPLIGDPLPLCGEAA